MSSLVRSNEQRWNEQWYLSLWFTSYLHRLADENILRVRILRVHSLPSLLFFKIKLDKISGNMTQDFGRHDYEFRATWLWFRATWLRARWVSGDLTGYFFGMLYAYFREIAHRYLKGCQALVKVLSPSCSIFLRESSEMESMETTLISDAVAFP